MKVDGLTLSWQRSLLYRNQSNDLQSKSMNWLLYDRDLCQERVNELILFAVVPLDCDSRPKVKLGT